LVTVNNYNINKNLKRVNMKKLLIILPFLILFVFYSCKKELTPVEREIAIIETDYGNIAIDFFENVAPNHVAVIKKLISEKFYDSLYFHRIVPGFVIQGGDPNTRDNDKSNDGLGQPGQPTINAEFSKIPHKRGILSMARKGHDVNTASSQFFICVADAPFLDNQYTIFGKVIEGMDVVDEIVNLERDNNDNPIKSPYMKRVYLEKKSIIPSEENIK
jgi:peptidyl-prolyl cis-trans isomerase B (cyclophilin B)